MGGMNNFTVVMLKVLKENGDHGFVASKGYEGFFFPAVGTTVVFTELEAKVEAVKWDITQNIVRVLLEPVILLEENHAALKRAVVTWGGDIEDE